MGYIWDIFFTCPSVKTTIDNVWKGEALLWTNILSHEKQASQISSVTLELLLSCYSWYICETSYW